MKLKYPPVGDPGPALGRPRIKRLYRSYQRENDIVVSTWPRSWTGTGFCQQYQRAQFALANKLITVINPTMVATARNFERGSQWTYKDFLTAAVFGRALAIQREDGEYMHPWPHTCPENTPKPTEPDMATYPWYNWTLNTTFADFYQVNARVLLPAVRMPSEKLTIILQGPTTADGGRITAWVGQQADSGNPYDFDGDQVQVGTGAIALPQNTLVPIDVDYHYPAERRLIISCWWGFDNPSPVAYQNVSGRAVSYDLAGVETDPAGTSAPAGSYTLNNRPVVVAAVLARP